MLIFLSVVAQQPYVAGLLLGLAVCIKPQLAFGFLLLSLALRQGRKAAAALATGLAVSGAALIGTKPEALAALASSISSAGSGSGVNSASALNPLRFQLINVDTLIPQALYSAAMVAIIYAIIASVSSVAVARAADSRVAVAVVASATVLVGYHRFYDAQILWLGVPVLLLAAQGRFVPAALRVAYGIFLIPGQTMTAIWLSRRPEGPWSTILLRQDTLAALAAWLGFVWIAIAHRERARPRAAAAGSGST